jgi:Flp pilus assembly protein TadB
VFAQISYSRVFELLFRFCHLLIRFIVIKSVAEKKKKKIRKFYEPYHQRGCIYLYSYSFIRFYSLVLVLVLVLILVLVLVFVFVLVLVLVLVLVSCFLDLITSRDKTRSHCLD